MVSAHPSSLPEAIDIIITFSPHNHQRSSCCYVASDVTDWQPQLMSQNGEGFEHVLTVPRGTRQVLYKFRIGEDRWMHDEEGAAEPDNRGGWNNRFEIPELPMTTIPERHPAHSESDAAELESVIGGVESIADTVSEVESHAYFSEAYSEAEYVNVDELDDETWSATHEAQAPPSWQQLFGLGLGVRSLC